MPLLPNRAKPFRPRKGWFLMRGQRDWRAEQVRYLVHFEDGGAGMRYRDERLAAGDELNEGGRRCVVERVEEAASPLALGHAWVRPIGGTG
jgi:hypothetical protein